MARYFAPISLREFRDKVDAIWDGDKYQLKHLTPRIATDLEKVEFDMENVSISEEYGWKDKKHLLGYQELDNGMILLGCNAGGDLEIPIYFCIYFSGKELRAYIPKDGNTWNTLNHSAIGNDSESDAKFLCNIFAREYVEGEDYGDFIENNKNLVDLDKNKIIQDIKARILPKP